MSNTRNSTRKVLTMRLPAPLIAALKDSAKTNWRTFTGEVEMRLTYSLEAEGKLPKGKTSNG